MLPMKGLGANKVQNTKTLDKKWDDHLGVVDRQNRMKYDRVMAHFGQIIVNFGYKNAQNGYISVRVFSIVF